MSKVLLGDVAVEHKETCKGSKDGYPIVGLEHLIPEEITLTAWDGGSENTFSKMFRKGNVLFGRRRAYLKKAAVAPFDGICSGDITVIEAKTDRILPELLPFIIQNDDLFDFAVGKSAGSLSPRVKWEHLKNYEFELPDMDKQKELAELLWAMDNTKKSYQKLIAATDELVKSQFMEQFGDPSNNVYGYPVTTLKEVAIGPLSYGSVSSATEFDGITRYVRITDIMDDGKLGGDIKSATKTDVKYLLSEGDILFARTGATVGKTCRYRESYGRAIYAGFLIRLIPDTTLIDSDYLYHFTKSDYYWDFVRSAQRVVAQPNINAQEYGDLQILLPKIEAQKSFAAFVRQSDKSKLLISKLKEFTLVDYRGMRRCKGILGNKRMRLKHRWRLGYEH